MADEGSSRKRRNREFKEVPLGTTLNDHVSNGDCARRKRVKTVLWTVFKESGKRAVSHLTRIERRVRSFVKQKHNLLPLLPNLDIYPAQSLCLNLIFALRLTLPQNSIKSL